MPRVPAPHLLPVALIALAVLIQLVPYGHDRSNPPNGTAVAWDSPRTEALARRACFDCHSNETKWPWYSAVAPVSWRIATHVREGRAKLNLTAFEAGNHEMAEAAGEAAKEVSGGSMPPADYLLLHPEARLGAEERRALVSGLRATFAAFSDGEGAEGRGPVGRDGRRGRDDDRDDDRD